VDHDKFRQLRKQVTGSAIVYGKKVLPFSELVVKAIHNYFEDYFLSIEFADFCECLDDLTKELNAAQKVVNCTKRLHENLLVEFKTFKIEAGKVSATLGLDVKKLKFQAEQHSATAKHKEAWAEIWGVLPVIGWIPAIMLKKEAERARDKQYTTEVNKQLVAQACYNIDNGLVTSVEYFAKAMSDLCGFFTQLHNDIERIDQNLEAKKSSFSSVRNELKRLLMPVVIFKMLSLMHKQPWWQFPNMNMKKVMFHNGCTSKKLKTSQLLHISPKLLPIMLSI